MKVVNISPRSALNTSRTHESKWRDFIKDIVCFSSMEERLLFVMKMFFKRFKEHMGDVSVYYYLLSFCKPTVCYPFDFVERIWGTGIPCTMIFILQELKEKSLCQVDFERCFLRFNESQSRLLISKRCFVRSYLSQRLGLPEDGIEEFFETQPRSPLTPEPTTEMKSVKKGKKKVKKGRKRKKKKALSSTSATLKLDELGEVMKRNEFISKLRFSRGYRIALVIGNSTYEKEELKLDSRTSTSCFDDDITLISSELIQNDCTAISYLLKNKLSFEVIQKKNLSGKEINAEVHRILSVVRALGRKRSGRPTIFFLFLTGHFEKGKFLGTDRKNSLDGNYLDLQRTYCEIEKSQSDKSDFCYMIMNPIQYCHENVNRASFLTRIPLGVPFQGVIASTTNFAPTLDSCFSKFSKFFCRFFETGRLDIIKVFRKLRKKKVEVQFQSNFGNFSTSEMILTPYACEGKNPRSSLMDDGKDIILSLPSVGGLVFEEKSSLEKLEFEIRDVKKKCGKSGFVIYFSDFNPPYIYEEKMMDAFKEAIEENYIFEEGIFASRYEEQSRMEAMGENTTQQEGNDGNKREFLEKYILQKFRDKKKKRKERNGETNDYKKNGGYSFRTPLVGRRRRRKGIEVAPFLSPPKNRRGHQTPKTSGKIRRTSCSVGKNKSFRRRKRKKTLEYTRSSKFAASKDTAVKTTTEYGDRVDNDEGFEGLGCTILRYLWVDFGDSVLLTLIEKTEKVKRVNLKVKRAQKEIIKLQHCVDPSPFLLYVFRFFFVLFIRKIEEEKNLLTQFKGLEEATKNNNDKENEDKEEAEKEKEEEEEVKVEENVDEAKEEEEEEKAVVDNDEISHPQEAGRSDFLKQEHARKVWSQYSSFVWSEDFLNHLYEYDFLVDGTGVLDQLEEIYENMKVFRPNEEGKVEKLLFELVKTWVEFFEYKYIQTGSIEKEDEKKEFLEAVTSKNPSIILSKGSKINSSMPGSNREVIQSTFQMMVEYIRYSVLLQTSIKSSDDFCCFLGLTDEKFLSGDFRDIVRDIPLVIGCTSAEKRSLVEKKLSLTKEYIHGFLRILVVDLFEEGSVSMDTRSTREEIAKKIEVEKRSKGRKWGKGKTRK